MMSPSTPLGELIQALGAGPPQPRHAWEALGIALALLLAAVCAHALGRVLARRLRPGASVALPGVLFPLIALVLLWMAEGLLRWGHVLSSAEDSRLMRLAIWLIGVLAAVRVLLALMRRVFRLTPLLARVQRLIGAIAILGIVLYATGMLDDVVDWLKSVEIPLGSAAHVSLWSVMAGSATMLVALLAAMWLGSVVEDRLQAETSLAPNLRTVLGRVARGVLLAVALLLAMSFSGVDLTVVSVFGGALGVGLGLGLQRIAGSYVSGFILLLDRSLQIGDVITVDKYHGQVTQISTRYTVLRSLDGTEAILPNEMLVGSAVVNYTLGNRRVGLSVSVTVGADVDLDKAFALMIAAAKAQPRVLPDPPPSAALRDFPSGNLLLEVGFTIADPENGRQNVQSDVAIAVFKAFRSNGIEIAAPRGVYRREDDASA